jgi:hypothetical protein
MSGETQKDESGWTVDTLKEFMTQRFADQDKAVQAALLAAKEAVLKAEVASEKRFESVNEFRGQLADQTATLMPRQEYTVQHAALMEKVNDLTDRVNISDGKARGSQITVGKIYAGLGAAVTILSIIVILANKVFS